jgi:hypothetical protein
MIIKTKGKFRVVSEHLDKKGKHKNLGESKTKAGAVKRLREVEYFKRHKD